VKINLCDYRSAESGATTDPRALEALIIVLKQWYPSATITIAENDATSVDASLNFRART
jgi:hypothetical protein